MTGNKGEWSEIYVFLKLLAEGKLNAADANLRAIPNAYYPIIKILRGDGTEIKEYVFDSAIKIVDGISKVVLGSFSISDFLKKEPYSTCTNLAK